MMVQCITCRKKEKNLECQIMGPLPEERVTAAPAWSPTSVDFFVHFQTRGETNKRSCGKAYGLIFNYLASRAVHADIATDYSTDGFHSTLSKADLLWLWISTFSGQSRAQVYHWRFRQKATFRVGSTKRSRVEIHSCWCSLAKWMFRSTRQVDEKSYKRSDWN